MYKLLIIGISIVVSTAFYSPVEEKPVKVLADGWTDILEIRDEIFEQFEDIDQCKSALEEELTGRKVRFKGYIKQIQPHFAKTKDYYFTAEPEPRCMPLYQSESFCGEEDPDYMRVLFNGTGKSEADMKILLKPHRNKYLKERGELKEVSVDKGNYKIYTYNKMFTLEATIRMASLSCRSQDCSDRYLTVHLNEWAFEGIPKK